MPTYTEILPDGTRREVKYRMKDSPTMKAIRLKQQSLRLSRLVNSGAIAPGDRKHQWREIVRQTDEKFAPSMGKLVEAPSS